MVKEDEGPVLFCFGHTREAGLWAPLPRVKPGDFDPGPSREASKVHHDAGDTQHPLVIAYIEARKRVRELVAAGFVEAHPAVEPFLTEMAKLVTLNAAGQDESDEAEVLRSELDALWDALDDEEQSFARHYKKVAPAWRPEED